MSLFDIFLWFQHSCGLINLAVPFQYPIMVLAGQRREQIASRRNPVRTRVRWTWTPDHHFQEDQELVLCIIPGLENKVHTPSNLQRRPIWSLEKYLKYENALKHHNVSSCNVHQHFSLMIIHLPTLFSSVRHSRHWRTRGQIRGLEENLSNLHMCGLKSKLADLFASSNLFSEVHLQYLLIHKAVRFASLSLQGLVKAPPYC